MEALKNSLRSQETSWGSDPAHNRMVTPDNGVDEITEVIASCKDDMENMVRCEHFFSSVGFFLECTIWQWTDLRSKFNNILKEHLTETQSCYFHATTVVVCCSFLVDAHALLRLQMIMAIVNSCRFKGSSSDEPRRVQVLDLYCLTRFESEGSRRGDVY